MTVFQTPYPKATFRKFALVLFLISFSIAFILIVFQPFGTSSFLHPLKIFILGGYGLVVFLSGILFFAVTDSLLSDAIKDKWTIGFQVILVFCTLILCQIACFFYYSFLFSTSISFSTFFNFLIIASSVSIVPMTFYFFIIYLQYKDVRHATSSQESIEKENPNIDIHRDNGLDEGPSSRLTLIGTGKREKFEFEAENLRLIKAEDNYVIVYVLKNNHLKKWMIRATMNEVDKQLTSQFLRIHRSYIINKNFVESMTGNVTNTKLKLQAINEEIPVSRTKVGEIREL